MSTSQLVPLLNSLAGSALTEADWKKIGITAAALSLESLLIKPGMRFLKELSSIAHYSGWQRALFLNAFSLKYEASHFVIHSPYDGQRLKMTTEELVSLINHLNPAYLILPPGTFTKIRSQLNSNIFVFLPFEDLVALNSIEQVGLYLHLKDSCDKIQQQRNHFSDLITYISIDDCSESTLGLLEVLSVQWIESDAPAKDALNGVVYVGTEHLPILSPRFQHQHEVISTHCLCEGCHQQLTYAYFHHLYQHTPGLCHRFLIQHNAYNCSIIIKNN